MLKLLFAGVLETNLLVAAAALTTCFTVAGCGDRVVDTTVSSADGSDVGDTSPASADVSELASDYLAPNRDVDILVVMDNSGSMSEEQLAFSNGVRRMTAQLDEQGVNYRVAVTTTDGGNPMCTETSPENGEFGMTPCLDRIENFVFDPGWESWPIEKGELCEEQCAGAPNGFKIVPSEGLGSDLKERAWIEVRDGKSNVAGDVSAIDALACGLPQGINGCGFESQLESMYQALSLTEKAGSPNHGFLRPHAALAIVILSDELDCSYNPEFGSIFDSNGAKAFWVDKEETTPKSGICFEAGVSCTGGSSFGSQFSDCEAVNYDLNGAEILDSDIAKSQAVLHPVSRYIDFVKAIESEKKRLSPAQDVVVSVISGVPVGYSNADSVLEYWAPDNAEEERSFGIAPGCTVSDYHIAFSPVRMKKFAEAFTPSDERNLYSVCANDYSQTMDSVADRILLELQ